MIDQGNAIYNVDVFGKTPLTYAIEYGNFDTTDMILVFARENPGRVVYTIRDIKNVLKSGHASAVDYLKNAFKMAESRDCGHRASMSSDLVALELPGDVLTRHNVSQMYDLPEGVDEETFEAEKKEVEMLVSRFKFNTELGSQDSLDFLEAMDECEMDEIWHTSFRYIIDSKWKKARVFIQGLAIAHLLYLVLLTVYATAFLHSNVYRGVIFALTLFFYSFEILQMSI